MFEPKFETKETTAPIDPDAIRDAVKEAYAPAAEVQRLAAKPALTPDEVATLYGISHSTLEKMRYDNRGPEYIQLGPRKVLYTPQAIQRWMEAQTIQPRAI